MERVAVLTRYVPKQLYKLRKRDATASIIVDGDSLLRFAWERDHSSEASGALQHAPPVLAIVASIEETLIDLCCLWNTIIVLFQGVYAHRFPDGTGAPFHAPYLAIRSSVRLHLIRHFGGHANIIVHDPELTVARSLPAAHGSGTALTEAAPLPPQTRIAWDIHADPLQLRTLLRAVRPAFYVWHLPKRKLEYSKELRNLVAGHMLRAAFICSFAGGSEPCHLLELASPHDDHPTNFRASEPEVWVRFAWRASERAASRAAAETDLAGFASASQALAALGAGTEGGERSERVERAADEVVAALAGLPLGLPIALSALAAEVQLRPRQALSLPAHTAVLVERVCSLDPSARGGRRPPDTRANVASTAGGVGAVEAAVCAAGGEEADAEAPRDVLAAASPRLLVAAVAASATPLRHPLVAALCKSFLLHAALLDAIPLSSRMFLSGSWDSTTNALADACLVCLDHPLAAALLGIPAPPLACAGPHQLSTAVVDFCDSRLLRVCIQLLREQALVTTGVASASGDGSGIAASESSLAVTVRHALGLTGLSASACIPACLESYQAALDVAFRLHHDCGPALSLPSSWTCAPFQEGGLPKHLVTEWTVEPSLARGAAAAAAARSRSRAPPELAYVAAGNVYVRAVLGAQTADALAPLTGAGGAVADAALGAAEDGGGHFHSDRALLAASSDPFDQLVSRYSGEEATTWSRQRDAKLTATTTKALLGTAFTSASLSWKAAEHSTGGKGKFRARGEGSGAGAGPAGIYEVHFNHEGAGKGAAPDFFSQSTVTVARGSSKGAKAGKGSSKRDVVAETQSRKAAAYIADREGRWDNLSKMSGVDTTILEFEVDLRALPFLERPEDRARARNLASVVAERQLSIAMRKAVHVASASAAGRTAPTEVFFRVYQRCEAALQRVHPALHALVRSDSFERPSPDSIATGGAGGVEPSAAGVSRGSSGKSARGPTEPHCSSLPLPHGPLASYAEASLAAVTADVESEEARDLLVQVVACFAKLGFADSYNKEINSALRAAAAAAGSARAGSARGRPPRFWRELLTSASEAAASPPISDWEAHRLPRAEPRACISRKAAPHVGFAAPAAALAGDASGVRLRAGTCSFVEFQLAMAGPHLARPRGSGPDPRVPFEPDHWQRELLDAVDAEHSCLVVAPTSAGKTFIAHYAIRKTLEESDDGVVVYVAPAKALVRQVVLEVDSLYDKRYEHRKSACVRGVFTRDDREDELRCQVLVTVPACLEILLLSIANAGWAHRVKRVILDEFHNMFQSADEEDSAPAVWERLIHLTSCPFVALSATVGDDRRLVGWLTDLEARRRPGGRLVHIRHDERWNDIAQYVWQHRAPSPKGARALRVSSCRSARKSALAGERCAGVGGCGGDSASAAREDDSDSDSDADACAAPGSGSAASGGAVGGGFVQLHPLVGVLPHHVGCLPGVDPTAGAIHSDTVAGATRLHGLQPSLELHLLPELSATLYPALLRAVEDALERSAAVVAAAVADPPAAAAAPPAPAPIPAAAVAAAAVDARVAALHELHRVLAVDIAPHRLFGPHERITLRAGRRYAGALVECMQRLAQADPEAGAAVLRHTIGAGKTAVSAASRAVLTVSERGYSFLHLPAMVADLAATQRLPALLFHLDRLGIDRLHRLLLFVLQLREEEWKENFRWRETALAEHSKTVQSARAELAVLERQKALDDQDQARVHELKKVIASARPNLDTILPAFTYFDRKLAVSLEQVADAMGWSEWKVRERLAEERRQLADALKVARAAVLAARPVGGKPAGGPSRPAGDAHAGAAGRMAGTRGRAAASAVAAAGGGRAPRVTAGEMIAWLAANWHDHRVYGSGLLCVLGLLRGLGAHHSGLKRAEKRAVETLFRQRAVRVVIATSTLGQGMNMPCRTVAFINSSPYLDAMLYRQLMGRAGRRGFDTRGDVVFFGFPKDALYGLLRGSLPAPATDWPLSPAVLLRTLIRHYGTLHPDGTAGEDPTLTAERRAFTGGLQRLVDHSFASFSPPGLPGHRVWSQPGAPALAGRFYWELLRGEGLVDSRAIPRGAAALSAYLQHTEPACFIMGALLRRGALYSLIRAAMDGTDARMNKLTREGANKYFDADGGTDEHVQRTAARVDNALLSLFCLLFQRHSAHPGTVPTATLRVSDLPADVADAIVEFDGSVIRRFAGFLKGWARAAHDAAQGGLPFDHPPAFTAASAALPLSGVQVPLRAAAAGAEVREVTSTEAPSLPSLQQLSAPPLLRSPFSALRGAADEFSTTADLLHHINGAIPAAPQHIPTLPSLSTPVSAYAVEFHICGDRHGAAERVGSTGGIGQRLNDLSFTIKAVSSALTREFFMRWDTQRGLAAQPEDDGSHGEADWEGGKGAGAGCGVRRAAAAAEMPRAAAVGTAASLRRVFADSNPETRRLARSHVATARRLPAGTFVDPTALYLDGTDREGSAESDTGAGSGAVASTADESDPPELVKAAASWWGPGAAVHDQDASALESAVALAQHMRASRSHSRTQLTTAEHQQKEAQRIHRFLVDIANGRLYVTPQEAKDFAVVMAVRGCHRRYARLLALKQLGAEGR
jgi:hypothetical protein